MLNSELGQGSWRKTRGLESSLSFNEDVTTWRHYIYIVPKDPAYFTQNIETKRIRARCLEFQKPSWYAQHKKIHSLRVKPNTKLSNKLLFCVFAFSPKETYTFDKKKFQSLCAFLSKTIDFVSLCRSSRNVLWPFHLWRFLWLFARTWHRMNGAGFKAKVVPGLSVLVAFFFLCTAGIQDGPNQEEIYKARSAPCWERQPKVRKNLCLVLRSFNLQAESLAQMEKFDSLSTKRI